LKVWLIESGEPLPTDDSPGRPWRIGLLADILWRRGHDVTWWAGTFDHAHKSYRASETTTTAFRERYSLHLLHGVPYTRNVSFARLRNHRQVAKEFARVAATQARPDVILCCVPTLELAGAAIDYGQREAVPVVLDYRDLWPEVFVEPFGALLRPVARVLIHPWYRLAHKSFAGATAITGITDEFVAKALQYARRPRREGLDRSFPHGYSTQPLDEGRLQRAFDFWAGLGIRKDSGQFVVCYFGQLSRRVEIRAAILAARSMADSGHAVRLVLCGHGELTRECQEWRGGSEAVLLPGFVEPAEIRALMQLSHAGILPYPSTPDFAASIPNKVIEYFSGGLPVLSSVQGVVSRLLDAQSAGLTYANDDPGSLRQAIGRYLGAPALRAAHASNAERLFRTTYTAEKVYGSMADHLQAIALARAT